MGIKTRQNRLRAFKYFVFNFSFLFLLLGVVVSGQCQVDLTLTWQSERQAMQTLQSWHSERRWDQVISGGDRFLQQYPRSESESTVMCLIADAALNSRHLDRAILEAKRLQLKFAGSAYIDDTHWILAQCALAAEKWDQAREQLGWIISFSTEPKLVEGARKRLSELDSFLDDLHKASTASRRIDSPLKVSLVLPLTGVNEEPAKEFLAGFQLTWHKQSVGDVTIFDSEDDPIQAALIARQTIREDAAWAVVGGLTDAETATLAAIAEAENTPFLTTVCATEGVAAIGRNVFQGRADYGMIGRKLARHALGVRGSGHFGILVPATQEGRQIARGLKQELSEAGGDVLAEEIYYPGSQDFKSYFERIRQIGLRRAFDDSLRTFFEVNGYLMRDTLRAEDLRSPYLSSIEIEWLDQIRYRPSAEYLSPQSLPEGVDLEPGEEPALTLSSVLLDTLWDNAHRRLHRWMVRKKEEIDSLEIPLTVFDGFLFVIEPSMTPIAAPQFARANLRTLLLGNEAWDDLDALSKNQKYVEGIVFPRAVAGIGGPEYYQFAAEISGDSLGRVTPYHLLGDRAARMIAFASARAHSREDMRVALSQIRDVKTLSGEVSLLKEERVDRNVNLMRMQMGRIEPVVERSDPFEEP